jgi:hypothetical protein
VTASLLSIMQRRLGGRLAWRFDVPDTLRAERVPPMSVQPLVENAVKHGIEPEIDGGAIEVRARREADGSLVVEVADTGGGLDAAQARAPPGRRRHRAGEPRRAAARDLRHGCPRGAARQRAARHGRAAGAAGAGRMSAAPRAVIADDEPLLRDALAAALAIAWPGLRIVAACADGDAALEAIVRERPRSRSSTSGCRARRPAGRARGCGARVPAAVGVRDRVRRACARGVRARGGRLLVKPIEAARLERTVARLRARLDERADAARERAAARVAPAPALDAAALARLAELIARPAAAPLRWLRASLRDELRWCRSTRSCCSRRPTSTCACSPATTRRWSGCR